MAAELKLTVTPVANSADIAANTSRVKIALQIVTTDGTFNLTGSTAGSLTLDGVQIASLDGKKVQKNTTTTLYSATRTVTHDPDGTKTITVKASFDVDTSVRWVYAEETVALPTILRCSTLTAGEFTTGAEGSLTVTPVAEGFTHAIHYAVGDMSGTVTEETADTALLWTPPMELACAIPDRAVGYGTLTLVSYYGGAETGRQDVPFTLRVSDDVVPTLTLTVALESDNGVIDGWGVAVKGRSRLRYQIDAQGAYGSTIVRSQFTFGAQSVEGPAGALTIAQSGHFSPVAEVTDSRGRIAGRIARGMDVYDYHLPVLTRGQVWRCDEDGRSDESGSFAAVVMEGTCAAVGGRNALSLRCRYRSVGGAWSGYTPVSAGETLVLPGFDPTVSYEVELSAVDTVGEEKTILCTVPTEAVTFALREGGVGAGFGKYPQQPGLDMGWGIWMNGHPITGLPQPSGESDATPWGWVNFDRVYPVGSLYLTVADVDPAALFGGVWQRIEDVFLLAAGSTYAPGSTGGAAEHTLTVEELPSHSHTIRLTAESLAIGSVYSRVSSDGTPVSTPMGSAGGNQPHNNMPPYLAVNVWQRTA